jgi:2-polyprenyl-3-methyl-5-hydroxy-6-metoxy-1,4-benzoquinol methylase
MKRVGFALLVMVLQATAFGQQSPGDPNTEREIRELSERYFDAMARRDAKVVEDLLVDECLIYYPRGVIKTKAALLEVLRKPVVAGEPGQPTYTLSEVKVRRVGETVVLTATLTAARVDAPGVINKHRRTLTWANQNGRWRLVHDQWSLVGDAAEAEYWSDYFQGQDQNFNRNPNRLLVQAIQGRRPGKALDVGMGEGRNAIYLAKQGWQVTGIDRAESALAVARQQANQQGVRITPILQSADEFDWGRQQWDLVALLYVGAVRGNVAKIRESLRPGGLVVIETFMKRPGSSKGGTDYEPGELRNLFSKGFQILHYEETETVADYGQRSMPLVRLIGCKTMLQTMPECRGTARRRFRGR